MKKRKKKGHRGLISFIFVLSLFIASACFIMHWWIALAAAFVTGFATLWNLMD